MKAAHGSPPLTRPNRHQYDSNSPCDRMKTGSRSNSHHQGTIMPPYLRLDSTGEVIKYDRPVKSVDHQKTNTGCQGSPVGGVREGWWGKFMSGLAPQQATSSDLLNSSRIKNGIAAFDELLNSRQAQGSVSMAGKPSHVKMAQTSLPHLNRYGQWGTMCPSYAFLPPGVFPCHVFQAQQSQRDPSSTSGHFVVKCMPSSLDSSLLDTCWKFSSEKTNSYLQKMGPISSTDIVPRRSDRGHSVENQRTVCACPQTGTCGCDSDMFRNTRGQDNSDRQRPGMESIEQEKQTRETSTKCTGSVSDHSGGVNQNKHDLAVERQHGTVETCSEPSLTVSTQGSDVPCDTDPAPHGKFHELKSDSNLKGEECLEISDSTEESCNLEEDAETVTSWDKSVNMATQVKNPAEDRLCVEPPREGAECWEILEEREGHSPSIDCGLVEWHPSVFTCMSGSEDLQSSFDHDDDEVSFDLGEKQVHLNTENSHTGDGKENEDIWKCFLSSQFCLSNMMSKPSRQEHSEEEEVDKEETPVPKPCPEVTQRWRKLYSSALSIDKHPCKVRFTCGEGRDVVHEYDKGEDETLTVMEIQKARDLSRQHQGKAAKLLQKGGGSWEQSDNSTDGATGSVVEGSGRELQGEGESSEHAFVVDSGLLCTEEDDSEDSSSDDSDYEDLGELDCESKDGGDAEDVSDDEFVVFEDG